MHRGEFERSVEEAEWAVRMAPYDARMLRHLTKVLAAAGRYEMALEWLATAQPREPGDGGRYHRQRAYLFRLMGRYEELAREYAAAAPLGIYHRLSLAIDYVRLGRMEEAERAGPRRAPIGAAVHAGVVAAGIVLQRSCRPRGRDRRPGSGWPAGELSRARALQNAAGTSIELKKRRPREAGVKSLRQVSYRQETYRAVEPLYEINVLSPSQKS